MGWLHPRKKIYNKIYIKNTIGIPTPTIIPWIITIGVGVIFFAGSVLFGFIILIIGIILILSSLARRNELIKTDSLQSASVPSSQNNEKSELNALSAEEANRIYMDTRAEVLSKWRLVTNSLNTATAQSYENLCKENIQQYYDWINIAEATTGFTRPIQVDAFVKLAMLYDKLGEYEKAVKICEEAIAAGACNDGTKGGMEGRMKRLEKKALSSS